MSLNLKTKKKTPRKAVEGAKILNRIFERDFDKGAIFCEISGTMGSGKTSLSLGFADRIMKKNPDEIIFWRESIDSPAQWNKIGSNKFQILSDSPIEIRELSNKNEVAPIKVNYFDSFKELNNMVKPQMLNVVYFQHPSRWLDLINYLTYNVQFQSIFLDEYEDVVPQRCSNALPEKQWSKNELFANSIKKIRKSLISVFGNTQSNMDVDVRVRSKLQFYIYCYGARRDKLSPISKQAIQSLQIGTAWVDSGHSLFGQFTFPPYFPKKKVYSVRYV